MPVKNDAYNPMAVEVEKPEDRVHTVVIDGSSFTFIDSVGLQALPSVSISTFLALQNERGKYSAFASDLLSSTYPVIRLNTRATFSTDQK